MQTKESEFCSVGSGEPKGFLSREVMIRLIHRVKESLCLELSSLVSFPTTQLG